MSGATPTSNGVAGSAGPRATPGSYMYTSSSGLLRSTGERAVARAVPPPTLPKYASVGGVGSGAGQPSSFRLASLDRLAHRQRLFDQQQPAPPQPPQDAPAASQPQPLQSKRELFFKNELPVTSSSGPTSLPNSISNNSGGGGGPTHNASTPSPAAPAPAPSPQPAAPPPAAPAAAKELQLQRPPPPPQPDNKESYAAARAERDKDSCAASKTERERVPERRTKELDGYVGFANLPNQVYRKAVKRGFDFTLMVVGESGLGKSTLINSMFLADIYSNEYPGPSHRIKKTVQVETSKVLLKENGVNLTLTVVDTPGFGDAVDNSNCWQPVIDYIESKYEEYLNAESRVNRKTLVDNRVHCCLYFIAPSGHGLKPLDVEFMQRLHDKVNIIPVIAKSDTMTPDECTHFKKQILNEISQHKIKIYEFPDPEDEEESKVNKTLKDRVPFAVVGSNTVIEVDGKKLRGRKYPWGIAEVENLEHCDFIALRDMLIRTHLQDLKDVTNNVHYENFRCRKLAGLGSDGKPTRISNKNPLAQMEEEKREHEAKMKKMEIEMEQVFEMKVKEKKQKLKDSEAELQRRHEQMRKTYEQQVKELEEKRREFEKEKQMWEQTNNVSLEDLRRRSLEANSKETMDGKDKNKKKKGLF
ncbi:septin-7 isoform X1 [Schistocerca gregaria]|uniref:septin-7 isoform X1 n=2 Tax=Schistocerca TaxID=7008 RepID=UPI00211F1F03|nr:septin-7 isoform X1 [Schistocerca gregaria]